MGIAGLNSGQVIDFANRSSKSEKGKINFTNFDLRYNFKNPPYFREKYLFWTIAASLFINPHKQTSQKYLNTSYFYL